MSNKILSVVIPTYNMEAYLPRCLDSVTREDVPKSLEVIVVNDGSKDRSLEIAKEYQAKRPDIINIIDKPNGHYGSCINAALKVATGKYFRPLDADDWFDTSVLINFLSKLENSDSDLVVSQVSIITPFGKKTPKLKELSYNTTYSSDNKIISSKNMDLLCMHCMTFKKSILEKSSLHLTEGICYTDGEYVFYPCKFVNSIIFFNDILYNYDMTREGQSMDRKSFERVHSHMFKILENILLKDDFNGILQESLLVNYCRAYYYRTIFCINCDSELKQLDKLMGDMHLNLRNRVDKQLFYTSVFWRFLGLHFFWYEKLKGRFKIASILNKP